MADISNVTPADIKEISDSLDALSCKNQHGPLSFQIFANEVTNSSYLDACTLLVFFLDRLLHSTALEIGATE